jgi:hypothetical protein
VDLRGKRVISALDLRKEIQPTSKTVPPDARFGDAAPKRGFGEAGDEFPYNPTTWKSSLIRSGMAPAEADRYIAETSEEWRNAMAPKQPRVRPGTVDSIFPPMPRMNPRRQRK